MTAFEFGMRVELNGDYGVVIKPTIHSEWGKEPGIIQWDTHLEKEPEDWRGLFGTFIDAGGRIILDESDFNYNS